MYEVEVRSLLTKEKYDELLAYFQKSAQFLNEDEQTTYYFKATSDLRLQQNKFNTKLVVKKGEVHDEIKEEVEVEFARDDFLKMHELLTALGYDLSIKWFRKRFSFRWEDVLVTLDDTRGYGFIIELEKTCGLGEKDQVLEKLKEKLSLLKITLTPKQEFDAKFEDYKRNWKALLGLNE